MMTPDHPLYESIAEQLFRHDLMKFVYDRKYETVIESPCSPSVKKAVVLDILYNFRIRDLLESIGVYDIAQYEVSGAINYNKDFAKALTIFKKYEDSCTNPLMTYLRSGEHPDLYKRVPSFIIASEYSRLMKVAGLDPCLNLDRPEPATE